MAQLFAVSFGAILVASFYTLQRLFYNKNRKLRLPPGPKPLPLLGNILDLPPTGKVEFQHWLKHKDVYGPLSSITVMGLTLVILHDKKAAMFLLEKKSAMTASRPYMEFGHNLCGYDNLFALQQYDETYRRRRKLIQKEFGTKSAVTQYQLVQETESRRLLRHILEAPQQFIQHTQKFSAAIILQITYGYSIEHTKLDPLVSLIDRMLDQITKSFVPMAWLVDVVPVLKYLPEGLPGTSFMKIARTWNETNQKVANLPFSFVQQRMQDDNYRPSLVSNLLSGMGFEKSHPSYVKDVKWVAAMQYVAGTETIWSTLSWFLLVMVLNPEVQHKAQEEIHRVTGDDRLPTFEDQEKLPFVNNLVTELYRWFPVVPMGVVHKSDENTIYGDYLIPKGAYLMPAVWWFCHDPEVYHYPSAFDPERYQEPRSEPDPRQYIFGFGRRICAGRYAADAAVFISIAHILAAFSISKAVDAQGKEIDVSIDPTPSVTSHPLPFSFRITPRTDRLANIVRSIDTEHSYEATDANFFKGVDM